MAEDLSSLPTQTPLFHAQQADRYERQELIGKYEDLYDCRLIVVIDAIFPQSVTPFEELIYNNPVDRDIHLMAPASDLGPIDPQFQFPNGSLVAAKDIIAAVEDATKKVQAAPETYPIHAALLSDVDALMVQQARSELLRTGDLLEEALKSNPDRTAAQVKALRSKFRVPLIQRPKTHAAIFNVTDAQKAGLPAEAVDQASEQWQRIWRLWAKYFAMGPPRVYEGRQASIILPWQAP